MAETLTVELDEKGNIGKLPDALQKFLDTKINDAFGRGAKKVEEELKGKLADPAQLERLKLLDDENSRLKEAEARANKNFEEANRLAQERHDKALADKDGALTAKEQEIARRDARLRASLGSEIKAAATAAGARDASLPELVKLLGADVDLDPTTLDAFVKGPDGKPATGKDGKPVTIEGFVQQYLADNPHHLNTTRGRSGKASGGLHLRGGQVDADKESAIEAAQDNPSAKNVTTAIGAIRKKTS